MGIMEAVNREMHRFKTIHYFVQFTQTTAPNTVCMAAILHRYLSIKVSLTNMPKYMCWFIMLNNVLRD